MRNQRCKQLNKGKIWMVVSKRYTENMEKEVKNENGRKSEKRGDDSFDFIRRDALFARAMRHVSGWDATAGEQDKVPRP